MELLIVFVLGVVLGGLLGISTVLYFNDCRDANQDESKHI